MILLSMRMLILILSYKGYCYFTFMSIVISQPRTNARSWIVGTTMLHEVDNQHVVLSKYIGLCLHLFNFSCIICERPNEHERHAQLHYCSNETHNTRLIGSCETNTA